MTDFNNADIYLTGIKVKFNGNTLYNKSITLRDKTDTYLLKRDSDGVEGKLVRDQYKEEYDEHGVTGSHYEWKFVENKTQKEYSIILDEIYTVLTPISYTQF